MDFLGHRMIGLNGVAMFALDFVIYPFITILLCLLSVFVVLGNLLVVSAIWHENQLHSVTNYLIASLAAADCLVGAVVMPSSIISEIIIGSWTFGSTWCDLWHSFDVLASTASIMNLCAISLDRYLAITNPISYPTKMTPKRVALLIVSLWTCSSLISFPAIAWWRAVGDGPLQTFKKHHNTMARESNETISTPEYKRSNEKSAASAASSSLSSSSSSSTIESQMTGVDEEEVLYRCVFTDDTYYLLFSSIVSFYGPLCVMLYAYYRIYKAAVQQTRFLKYGSKQVIIGNSKRNKRLRNLSSGDQNNHGTNEKYGLPETTVDGVSTTDNYDTTHLVLRAHRGGGGGSSAQTSSNKLVHAESNSSASRADHRASRKENHSTTNSEAMVRISFDDDTTQQETLVMAEQTRLSSKLTDLRLRDSQKRRFGDTSRSVGIPIDRRARIESIVSLKKDNKTRIGSQRFDSINEIAIENGSPSNASEINQRFAEAQTSKSNEDLSANELLNDTPMGLANSQRQLQLSAQAYHNSVKTKAEQTNLSTGKALLASIKKKSNNVDVSIVDDNVPNKIRAMPLSRQPKHGFFYPRSICSWNNDISRLRSRNESLQDHWKGHSDDKIREAHQRSIEETNETSKAEQDDSHVGEDDDNDDDDDDSLSISSSGSTGSRGSSSSSNSNSYGTGSIISVLVKPKLADQKNLNGAQLQAKQSCDTIDKRAISTKMRRALSVGDADRNSQTGRSHFDDIESGMVRKNHEILDESLVRGCMKKLPSSVTMPVKKNKQRASHGNTSAMLQEFRKNSKTIDIRFWVRKSRSRCKKTSEVNSNESFDHMKPPPSLMPLMMMNSDTSTDSSLTADKMDRNNGGPTTMACVSSKDSLNGNVSGRRNDLKKPNGSTQKQRVLSKEFDGVAGRTNSALSLETTLRQNSAPEQNSKKHGQHLARNFSFKDDKEQNKVQMLYYDSDKLIQSIVNLTDIHYIDCTNRGAQSISKTKEDYATAAASACRPEKSSLSTIDQCQVPQAQDEDRISAATVARQRSTGKKLTKLAKERKAAKTLGIVVGVFILCWLPFFVVNIVVALCGMNCIYKPQILLAIVTWLGWLNSAMNPVIYACWSRDFRRAFRRVLCTWVECLYPYDNGKLARKLRLKKRSSNYSTTHEAQLQRTASRSKFANTANNLVVSAPINWNGLTQRPDEKAKRSPNADGLRTPLSDQ